MSIATEITRLQNAKSSIVQAIEDKGVSVPDNVKIDEVATYVENIDTANDAVRYNPQTLTDEQKKQARENIGGVEVVISETQPTNQNIGDIWLKIK